MEIISESEKAQELISVYGVNFSLLIVDEILKEISHNIKCDFMNDRRNSEETIIFWNKVKKELNLYISL